MTMATTSATAPTAAPISGPRPAFVIQSAGPRAAGVEAAGAEAEAAVAGAGPVGVEAVKAGWPTAATAPLADGQFDPLLVGAAGDTPLRNGRWPDSRSRFTRWRSARMSAAVWYRSWRSFSSALAMIRSSSGGISAFNSIGACGSPIENGVEDHGRGVARERPLPGCHLVEHDAKREQVGASVQVLAARLLGGHVGDGSEGHALVVSVSESGRVGGTSSRPAAVRPMGFARPKSSIFACPRVVTKMLAGLMSRCTMPCECAASSASAIWIAKIEQSADREGLSVDVLLERSVPRAAPWR